MTVDVVEHVWSFVFRYLVFGVQVRAIVHNEEYGWSMQWDKIAFC